MSPGESFGLHPGAAQDITDIWEYIADDSPLAASRVREDILNAIRELARFPQLGHRRPDLTSRALRFYTVLNYLIAYLPDQKPILVLAVLHGRLSPRVMAAILRGREYTRKMEMT